MLNREPVVISWSGGKDSMLALHDIQSSGEFEVVAALTTVSQEYERICMHGVRRSLLHRQVEALDLPLREIVLPPHPSNIQYEAGLTEALEFYKAQGVQRIIFGDIFLADLKAYRDAYLARLGMTGIYPLWLQDSRALVQRFLSLGYATILACVDTKALSGEFAGRTLDEVLLHELPPAVDPCGENGEFHTFVWKGPLFRKSLSLRVGEKVLRDQFMYCDLLEKRIISFLPSATEMVCALGLADQLVGITHECDYPEAIRDKAIVVRNATDLSALSVPEIDQAVSRQLQTGAGLYQVDEALIRRLEPDLILTQNLCQVCAPSGHEITRLLKTLPKQPDILWLTPTCLKDIEQNMLAIAQATGTVEIAERLVANGQERLRKIKDRYQISAQRPRVFCVEWVDPLYCSGHWIPEMVELAGGEDALGRRGMDSARIPWSHVLEWDPEILIVAPCGFKLAQAKKQTRQLSKNPGWKTLSAVRQGRVYAVDANAYFARPGPRVIDGVELLAHLIHPELFGWSGAPDAFFKFPAEHKKSEPKIKTCPECKNTFTCYSGGCWCEKLPPLRSLDEKSDCLCASCLQKAVSKCQ